MSALDYIHTLALVTDQDLPPHTEPTRASPCFIPILLSTLPMLVALYSRFFVSERMFLDRKSVV